jgi:phenylacetate-CoA ligase
MLNKIREKSFWLIDKIFNSNQITKNINEIKLINNSSMSENINQIYQINLTNILKHASNKSEFYKDLDFSSLKNFPVINKTIINKDHSKFLTSNSDNLFKTTTSGSTGTPLIIYQDKVKRDRHKADNIYFNEFSGLKIGSKLYYFRVWNKKNSKNFLTKWFQNIEMVDISLMTTESLDKLLNIMINDTSEKSILSFASSLDVLKNHCYNMKVDLTHLQLKCIISMSEALATDTRKFLEENIMCNVVSRYSNMENGFIAQQKVDSSDYLINQASFLVETLELDSDTPVMDNKMGRIVVTDLFNYGMPIIRYDTGDIGIKGVDENDKPILKSIEGRRIDFITNTNGELLSPHIITNSMWFFAEELNQFQFIQKTSKEYTLKLNMKKLDNKIHINKIQDKLIPFLGKDAILEIEYVNEIPLLDSGKRKKVVNLMTKK